MKAPIRVLKHEGNKKDGFSVLVTSSLFKFTAWIDVRDDGNDVDWNQYIFYLNNSKDRRARNKQNNSTIFSEFASAALNYLEAKSLITNP